MLPEYVIWLVVLPIIGYVYYRLFRFIAEIIDKLRKL